MYLFLVSYHSMLRKHTGLCIERRNCWFVIGVNGAPLSLLATVEMNCWGGWRADSADVLNSVEEFHSLSLLLIEIHVDALDLFCVPTGKYHIWHGFAQLLRHLFKDRRLYELPDMLIDILYRVNFTNSFGGSVSAFRKFRWIFIWRLIPEGKSIKEQKVKRRKFIFELSC